MINPYTPNLRIGGTSPLLRDPKDNTTVLDTNRNGQVDHTDMRVMADFKMETVTGWAGINYDFLQACARYDQRTTSLDVACDLSVFLYSNRGMTITNVKPSRPIEGYDSLVFRFDAQQHYAEYLVKK